MKREEFDILVANVTAIANQTFTIQCGEFATAVAADEDNDVTVEDFSLEKHLGEFDFKSIIESGYQQLSDVTEELDEAWQVADTEYLEIITSQLPNELASLMQKVSGDDFKRWVSHALKAQDDSPFYAVHHYVMSLFRGDVTLDDDSYDLIREAIAFNDVGELEEIKEQITAENIRLDDLITAAAIQSFTAFEWLYNKTELTDDQVTELLGNLFDEQFVFEQVFNIISPTDNQRVSVLNLAKDNSKTNVVEFLESKLKEI